MLCIRKTGKRRKPDGNAHIRALPSGSSRSILSVSLPQHLQNHKNASEISCACGRAAKPQACSINHFWLSFYSHTNPRFSSRQADILLQYRWNNGSFLRGRFRKHTLETCRIVLLPSFCVCDRRGKLKCFRKEERKRSLE